jgi:hypothetical protein
LDPHIHLFSPRSPLRLSVLGRGGETNAAFRSGIVADLEAIHTFRDRHGAAVVVDVYEVKLPSGVILDLAAEGLQWPAGMSAFCEVSPAEGASSIAAVGDTGAGFKLRCGGLDAAAFPDPGRVAHVIGACRDNGLSLKFTAGLHHPVRHFDRNLGTKTHGFLNVFGAGVLAHALGVGERQLREIIEDEDPGSFGLDEEGFEWKQYLALPDEIVKARREFVISFGSCSFDEPRADLRAMGILP